MPHIRQHVHLLIETTEGIRFAYACESHDSATALVEKWFPGGTWSDSLVSPTCEDYSHPKVKTCRIIRLYKRR